MADAASFAPPCVSRPSPQAEDEVIAPSLGCPSLLRCGTTVTMPAASPQEENRPATRRSTSLFDFTNTEAITERVRSQRLKPRPYNVHDFYHRRGFFQFLARHPLFDNFTLGVIVFNAFWISIDTDLNKAATLLDAEPLFITADVLFFGYFSLELFVRFMAFEQKRNCCRDAWFVFDSTLVALYAFDPFMIAIMAMAAGGGGLNLPTSVLRLFRLARLSRLVRMLRAFPELMVMIRGMVTAAASVGYTLGLLLIITYVFAIALVNMRPDTDIAVTYFSTVPESMHNLIIFGAFLDALSDFILQVKAESTACFFLTWLYIALASLTVMNMLIGVLCEVVSGVAQEENETTMVEMVRHRIEGVMNALDENHDGFLSWSEFQRILENQKLIDVLESVNVDAIGMVDMAEDFFFEDGVPVSVKLEEFTSWILDLRGGQTATVRDTMRLGKTFSRKFGGLNLQVDRLHRNMMEARGRLETLSARSAANW
mmetsp:Transcript_43912/g.121525  ORF Transcript_43912/g.121525 Transcript_43912/m.121525 type:complete len:484 (-) Transcript_43912:197-1648(-)